MAATMRSRLANLANHRQQQADEAFERARDAYDWDPFAEEEIQRARSEADDAAWAAEEARRERLIFSS